MIVGRWVESARRLPARLAHALGVVGEAIGWALRLRLREGLRFRKYAKLIRRSGLFDPDHYLAQCGDDPEARRDPVLHYLRHGAARGLDPEPFFETSSYLEQHPEAAPPGKNPLVHFIRNTALDRFAPRIARRKGAPLVDAMELLWAPGLQVPPRQRVLLADRRLLTPDRDSASVRMLAILELLGELGYEVTFVSGSAARLTRSEPALRRLASRILYGPLEVLEHLRLEGGSYRHAFLSRPEQAYRYLPMVRALAPSASVIYDTVDLHWVRLARAAELTGDPVAKANVELFRKLERLNAAASDLTLAITEQERHLLASEIPEVRVAVLPNVHEVRPSVAPLEGRRDLLFIGGFEHRPNVDAVRWFVEAVLPRVRLAIPEVVFHVVGSSPTPQVRSLASAAVHVAGHVPEVDRLFEQSRVFVSPLRYGAGMKGKIGHAMGFGLPVVTTSVGSEGLQLVDGQHALIADGATAFSEAVIRLYRDPVLWGRLAESSRRHVEAHFSARAVRPLLADLLATARPGPIRATGRSRDGAAA